MIRKFRQPKDIEQARRRSRRTGRRKVGAESGRRAQLEALEPRVVLAANDPFISEFQALNTSTLQDEDGDFEDWIEINNPDTVARDLSGWYLTDDASELRKWRFPAGTVLDPGEHLVVFASGKNRVDPQKRFPRRLRRRGEC